ncbi:MAG: hypothetical protein VKL42_00015 [Snowella sp.]|nr:hypothetical protein [Snowella sp.]
MARQKRSVSDDYVNKLKVIATKVLDDWEKTPSSYSECNIQKITLERWQKGENLPSIRSLESFLRFLRLTQKRWDEYLDDKIDFDTFWGLRGKELEDRVITMNTCLNDIKTLSFDEKMGIIKEIANMLMTTETVKKVNLITLMPSQLKRLKTLLMFSRKELGEKDFETFKEVIDQGANQSLITSIVKEEITGFNKEDFEYLTRFLLKPSQWVSDDFVLVIPNQFINSFDELMKELKG